MRRVDLLGWPRDRAGRLVSVFGASALLISSGVVGSAQAIQGGMTTGVRAFTMDEGVALQIVGSVGLLAGFTLIYWRGLVVPAALSGLLTWIPAFAYFALRHPGWSPLFVLNGQVPRPGWVALGIVASFWICLLLAVLFWRHRCRRWNAST